MINPIVELNKKKYEAQPRKTIDFDWYLKELFLAHKYGDRKKFSMSLDKLAPYLDTQVYEVLTEIERSWLFNGGFQ